MKRSPLAGACLLALSLMMGSGAAYAKTPPDQLIIGMNMNNLLTLDPAAMTGNEVVGIVVNLYDSLVELDPNALTNVRPALATSWDISPDRKTLTFHLRDDVKFHSGNPLTAEDVVWSMRRLLHLNLAQASVWKSYGFSKQNIDSQISAPDAYTVQIVLPKPNDPQLVIYSLGALGNLGVLDSKTVQQHAVNNDWGNRWLTTNEAGSGPFMLKSWRKGQQLVMVPNPHWPGEKPHFKRVSVKIIGESASRRLQLSRGDLDIADALPVDQLAALKQEGKVAVAEYPSLRVTYLYLNNSKPPMNQVDLRRAVSWATDYQGMVKGILSGNGKQMRGPIPEGMWGFDTNAMQYSFDEAKAKAALEKVNDKPASLTFLYSDNDPNWEPIALSTQASLGKLGINVKLEKLANATMRDRVGKGDYDIAIGNWSPDFADPYMFMNYWFESDKKGLPGNRSFYENKEVDALLQAALKTTDQAERTKDYQQAQKVVIDEAAYVYLFQKNYQLAMNKEVKGFTFNPMLEQVFNIATMSK